MNGSVRALKQMLNNPMIYREPCKELDKKQNAYRTLAKVMSVNIIKLNEKPELT